MAIGTPYLAATTVTSTATANSDTITTNVDVPATDCLLLAVATRLATATNITSVTGGSGLTFDKYQMVDGGQNGDGGFVNVYGGATITNGTTFTINYDQSPTRHWVAAVGVPGMAKAVADANHIGTGNGTGTQPTATTAGSTPAAGDIAWGIHIHVGAGAQNETGTPTTNFTEMVDGPFVGGVSPFMHGYLEYDVLAAGGAATSAPTFLSNSGGWLSMVVVFQPAPPAAVATSFDELVASGMRSG